MSTQSRLFCFTWNNYTSTEISDHLNEDIEYAQWGEEVAPTTGTPHLQGVIYLKKKKTLTGVINADYFDGKPSYRMCRGTLLDNIIYTGKDGNYREFGIKPDDPGSIGGNSQKDKWKNIWAYVKSKEYTYDGLGEQWPMEALLHGEKLDRAHHRLRPADPSRSNLENYWIVGTTGQGKTEAAKKFGEFYKWDCDEKWFYDPFNYQPVLIIDEFTPGALKFRALSIIADHDAFVKEFKGGHYAPYRPKIVVVTSNYTVEECFPGRDKEPLRRRFKEINMKDCPKRQRVDVDLTQ